jgi:hypothetical protein
VKLKIELPEVGIAATAELYRDAAPDVTAAILAALTTPLESTTRHACFDGHEVYWFLPEMADDLPLQNRTMRPSPGELMYFGARPSDFAFLADDRLTPPVGSVHEMAFMYGEVDLRHYWEEGFHGSLFGRVTDGLDELAEACARTLAEGGTAVRVSRVEG